VYRAAGAELHNWRELSSTHDDGHLLAQSPRHRSRIGSERLVQFRSLVVRHRQFQVPSGVIPAGAAPQGDVMRGKYEFPGIEIHGIEIEDL